jgi:hypothetical protein
MKPTRSSRPGSVRLAVEPLEPRRAPAVLVNPTTVTYTDVDGDTVTVRTTKGTFDVASNFLFVDTDPGPAVREQLQQIKVGADFDGATLTVIATRSSTNGGDGFANVGYIFANSHLGAVTVDGDLGRIMAGDSAPGSTAIQSLTVQSMGRFGTTTQAPGGTLFSGIAGNVGSFVVKDDVVGATVSANSTGARIASVRIGGSLIGSSDGQISAEILGTVKIGGDVRGGTGFYSGSITGGRIGPVTIGGSLLGGSGENSGQIRSWTGDIGLVTIRGNMLGGTNLLTGSVVTFTGKIAGVTVGGSLVGGTSVNGVDGASIYAKGALGPVKIGGDLRGSQTRNAVVHSDAGIASVVIRGSLVGGGQDSAVISADILGPVTISGSVLGGSGQGSAGIFATTSMGLVRIAGDLMGGAGIGAGAVLSLGNLAGVAVGGSVMGGTASQNPGQIYADANMGPVAIAGDLRGVAADTANVFAQGNIASVMIGGSLIGGAVNSGQIVRVVESGDVGPVTVKGDIIAGTAASSGQIVVENGNLASLTVGGSLVGGPDFSGAVHVAGVTGGNIGPVKIGGNVTGGSGGQSGRVSANNIGPVIVRGALRGGGGTDSGEIRSQGSIGAVWIGRDVTAGTASDTGRIFAATGPIARVTIGGSLTGGFFNRTGEILTAGNLGPVSVAGDIRGGSAFGFASLDRSGYVEGKNIAGVTVGGSVVAGVWDGLPGTFTKNASIRAAEQLGPVVVKGSLVGASIAPVTITARGPISGPGTLAIQSLTVGGRVEFARILAGYNVELAGMNGNAQIGAVIVGGNWVASSIAAGVLPVNGLFGDADDAPLFPVDDGIAARIASITIRGTALGTLIGGDHFGFVAQQIGSLSIGGTAYPLKLGAGNDLAGLAVGATGDLRVREVAV